MTDDHRLSKSTATATAIQCPHHTRKEITACRHQLTPKNQKKKLTFSSSLLSTPCLSRSLSALLTNIPRIASKLPFEALDEESEALRHGTEDEVCWAEGGLGFAIDGWARQCLERGGLTLLVCEIGNAIWGARVRAVPAWYRRKECQRRRYRTRVSWVMHGHRL